MYRALVPIVNLVAALVLGGFFQSGVGLNIEVPDIVVAGTEFEVKVTLQKGDLESFSRLQQTFPAGLKASSYLSSNADFSFEEKRARFIWLRLPKQENFTVVYKIKSDERLKGTFTIDGKFSYIDQNERKSVSSTSYPVIIQPSPNIDPSLIVDIDDYERLIIPYISPAVAEPQMACVRQDPQQQDDGSYIITLLVNKEEKQKFAKIEEMVPEGYTAESIDPRESIFTMKGNKAKFLWMNLPSDQYFTVSYKLTPKKANMAAPFLNGKFSYLEGEKTMSIDIRQTPTDLANLSPDMVPAILASATMPQLAQQAEEPVKVEPEIKEPTEVVEVVKDVQIPVKEIATKEQKKPPKEQKPTASERRMNKAYMIEPEDGIYYRVQLAAGHKSVNIPRYFRKYKLDKEVRKELHEGWHKYSVGSFPIYKEARDYRVHIWNTTPIDDAFVSAYNSGQRITVQEALMVANQKWYK